MAAVEQLSFDEINTWRKDVLKHFLKKRGLKVSGRKEELVARLFAAAEQNMPVCLDAAPSLFRRNVKASVFSKLLKAES